MSVEMMSNQPVTAVEQPTVSASALPLRRDEVVSTSFMLQTLLTLVVLLGGLALLLKWLAKKTPGKWANKGARRIAVLEAVRISARTRVTLIELDGIKAAITETPQGASLQFLPIAVDQKNTADTTHSQPTDNQEGRIE